MAPENEFLRSVRCGMAAMALFVRSYKFSHLCRTPTCDLALCTYWHDDSIRHASIASRGNKMIFTLHVDVVTIVTCRTKKRGHRRTSGKRSAWIRHPRPIFTSASNVNTARWPRSY